MVRKVTEKRKKWQVCLLAGVILAGSLISPMQGRKADRCYAAEVQEGTLADGTYSISGVLRHATQDQDSMGNTAIAKPLTLKVADGQCSLILDLVPLTIRLGKKDFNGYLAELLYFPQIEGSLPSENDMAVGADILSQYDGVYDSYNDPENGLDENVKGMIYPKQIAIPVNAGETQIWTQVYVPVMEAVSAGSGEQYAKLQLDWNTLKLLSQPTEPSTEAPSTEEPSTDQPSTDQPSTDQPSTDPSTSTNGGQNQKPDKSGLHTLLLSATSLSGRESVYTKDSLDALKKAIAAAQNVYDNENATKLQITKQQNALSQAIINLEQKKQTSSTEKSTQEELDIKTLSDGVYYLSGKMLKTDKQSVSMANEALDHTVKLTVKKKKYTLTLNFSGLTINGQKGYLGWLKYYKTGYKTDAYGAPSGSMQAVTVTKKQNNADYPKEISFSMIEEAKEDGYVPLQVFVPVMDAISAGSGTQNVYLKLDLEGITQDKKSVKKESESNQTDGSSSKKNTGSTTAGSTSAGSKAVAKNGGSSLGNQGLSGSGTASKGNTARSEVQTGEKKTFSEKGKNTESARLSNPVEASKVPETESTSGTNTEDIPKSEKSGHGNPVAAALPSLGAILVAGTGVLYKMRSRRWVL